MKMYLTNDDASAFVRIYKKLPVLYVRNIAYNYF